MKLCVEGFSFISFTNFVQVKIECCAFQVSVHVQVRASIQCVSVASIKVDQTALDRSAAQISDNRDSKVNERTGAATCHTSSFICHD